MKKLKKILLPLATAILVIAISIGATLAYLTDEATADNVMTVGNVKISLLEFERTDVETPNATNSAVVQEFSNKKKPLLPAVIESGFDYTASTAHSVDWNQPDKGGNVIKPNYSSNIWDPTKINNEVDKMVFVKNTGDYSAYVRVFFAFEAGNYEVFEDFQKKIHLNINETDWNFEFIPFVGKSEDSNYFVASAIYPKELAPGEVTEITLSQIALDSSAENDDVDAFGDGYSVLVCAQAIQSAGFATPKQAIREGFGRGIPFKNIKIDGVSMYDALHSYNVDGGHTSVDITKKVTDVTFALNDDYPEISDNYPCTPSNFEQDHYVNAHYVYDEETGTYKIFFLADGPIYAPESCYGMFYSMSALVTVDTTNFNTSKTNNMHGMFHSCAKLKSVKNINNWAVSNVTTMYAMFDFCRALETISLKGWKTDKLVNIEYMFASCTSLKYVDVSGLDTKNVKTMYRAFYCCGLLESVVGINTWDTKNVTTMEQMFIEAHMLTELDMSCFDSSSLTTTANMFANCESLGTVRFGENWDMANVGTTNYMFNRCTALKTIYVATDWNTDNWRNFSGVFGGCTSLKGGNGTVFDPANDYKEYARIDKPDAPGYLTLVPADNTNP